MARQNLGVNPPKKEYWLLKTSYNFPDLTTQDFCKYIGKIGRKSRFFRTVNHKTFRQAIWLYVYNTL